MKSSYHHGDLRSALIERGLKLLAERAGDSLSLREIARDVGVSPTAVYRHFPDKGALMAALAREGLSRLATAQRQAAEAQGGGAKGFAATGQAYVRFALANPALFRLIFASPSLSAPHRPMDLSPPPSHDRSDAIAFLLANAAATLPPGADRHAVEIAALQAWSLAHGLAMLMLDRQVPVEDSVIEAVFGGEALGVGVAGRDASSASV
jgi:AcrR family transcriptional regulator